jgi:molecular chaperone IbpA
MLISSKCKRELGFTVRHHKGLVPFDNMVTEKSTYPHHNIVKKEDNKYIVELAVSGFTDADIDIEIVDSTLHIRGAKEDNVEVTYLHRGIATRSFHKTVRLAETVEVTGADLENGILKVYLENKVEEKKSVKVPIGKIAGKKQLLVE